MKTYIECIPCILRQTSDALALCGVGDQTGRDIMRRVLVLLSDMPFDAPPPVMTGAVHKMIRDMSGVKDPYASVKKIATDATLGMLGSAAKTVKKSIDPFETAVKLSIAGNIIDFGAFADIGADKIKKAVRRAIYNDIDSKRVRELKRRTDAAKSILFIGDNAGETVFDRLLIERFPENSVTYAVKSGPIINDATHEDALAAGIDNLARIIGTGSDMTGAILDKCSSEFLRILNEADVVIAKGQANYETLAGCGREVFHLMQVKCAVRARDTGMPVGTWLISSTAVSGKDA